MRSKTTVGAAVFVAAGSLLGLVACDPKPPEGPWVGTFTPHSVNGGEKHYDAGDIVTEAKALGVTIQRVQQVIGQPLGDDVATYRRNGIAAQVTVKANTGTISQPLTTTAKRDAFRRGVEDLLDAYHTPLLAVENEETADNFYAGTPDQYLAELKIAVSVAKEKGVKVTDGGVQWPAVALVTWNHVRLTRGTTAADAFLATVFRGPSTRWIIGDLHGVRQENTDPYAELGPGTTRGDNLRTAWRDAQYLFEHFGAAPGEAHIDYVNFHWYTPDADGFRAADTQALRDAVTTLRDITGLTPVTNEIGQRGLTPQAVTSSLRVLVDEERLPFVLWFDADGIPARALFETPGNLRDNGKAFAAAVRR